MSEQDRVNQVVKGNGVDSLSENVSMVLAHWNMGKAKDASCNSFAHTMVGACIVLLLEDGRWHGGVEDNASIVPKQKGWTINRDTQHSENIAHLHNKVSGNTGSDQLGTVCRCLDCFLPLGEPSHRSVIDEEEDTGNRTAGKLVMSMVSIDIASDPSLSSIGIGHTVGHFLLGIRIKFLPVVIIGSWELRGVSIGWVNDYAPLLVLLEVAEDSFHSIEVTLMGCKVIATEGTGGKVNIESSQIDTPIGAANE